MEQEMTAQPHASAQLRPPENQSRFDLRTVRKCGARCKGTGKPCQQPAMPNGRCKLHGGKSPGPPKGNRNAWKHGRYSAEAIARRRMLRALLREMQEAAKLAEQY